VNYEEALRVVVGLARKAIVSQQDEPHRNEAIATVCAANGMMAEASEAAQISEYLREADAAQLRLDGLLRADR
jgi:hypothetical protein